MDLEMFQESIRWFSGWERSLGGRSSESIQKNQKAKGFIPGLISIHSLQIVEKILAYMTGVYHNDETNFLKERRGPDLFCISVCSKIPKENPVCQENLSFFVTFVKFRKQDVDFKIIFTDL